MLKRRLFGDRTTSTSVSLEVSSHYAVLLWNGFLQLQVPKGHVILCKQRGSFPGFPLKKHTKENVIYGFLSFDHFFHR